MFALGVIFITLAIPLAFDGRTTSAIWAVVGAAVVWASVRQKRRLALAAGLLLQLAELLLVAVELLRFAFECVAIEQELGELLLLLVAAVAWEQEEVCTIAAEVVALRRHGSIPAAGVARMALPLDRPHADDVVDEEPPPPVALHARERG